MKISRVVASAFILAAFSVAPARADNVEITLDVIFSSAAPGSPGTWQIFAEVIETAGGVADGSFGISAVRAILDNIDFGTNGDAISIEAPGAINPIPTSGGSREPVLDLGDGTIDIIYGQNISDSRAIVIGVGVGGPDLIMEGTFSAGQPPQFGTDMTGSVDLFTEALLLGGTTPVPSIDPDEVILIRTVQGVPEPTSFALLLVAGLALTSQRRSRG